MLLSDLEARLKARCPSFAMIDHALTSTLEFDYPAALIAPAKNGASPEQLIGDVVYSQDVTQTFSIFVFLGRKQDRGLQSNADDLDALTAELRAALCGWRGTNPALGDAPMNYAGGQLDKFQTGQVCWREDFTVTSELRITVNG